MVAKLASIAVHRYRCFADEFRLALAPITLLCGWNNAGKSAALRLVGLLNDSLRPNAWVPFNTMGRFGREASFLDLEWKGSADSDEPGFGLELAWSGCPLQSARYQLDYSRERNEPYVRRLSLRRSQRPSEVVEFRAAAKPPLFDVAGANPVALRFTGLVPELNSGNVAATRVRRGTPCLAVVPTQTSWLDGQVSVKLAVRLLERPLKLLLENRDTDWAFIERMLPSEDREWLIQWREAGLLEPEQGGGLPEVMKRVSALSAPETDQQWIERLRLWILFDRDSDPRDRSQESGCSASHSAGPRDPVAVALAMLPYRSGALQRIDPPLLA